MSDLNSKVELKKQKTIHPATKTVTFLCATCNSSFPILSTMNVEQVGVDVCSNCHPVYVGSGAQVKARGRAERLSHRFVATGKEHAPEEKKKGIFSRLSKRSSEKKRDKKVKSFSEL